MAVVNREYGDFNGENISDVFFFFKQKTAYDIMPSLVGSEMCIRDSPDSMTSIGFYAFDGCMALTSVTIPNSVTSIEAGAFWGCTGLTSVTIPASVTSIGDGAFYGCTGLTSFTVDAGNSSYSSSTDGVLFNKAMTTLIQYPGSKQGAYVIPNSVTSIGNNAFQGCTGLTAAYFLGNAPTGTSNMFQSCAPGFTVHYVTGTTGWSNPWYGYPTTNSVINSYILTYTPGANGTITGTSPQTVDYGADGTTVTAVPNSGYHFVQWNDGITTAARTDTNVTADKTVTATFTSSATDAVWTYTLAGGNATITKYTSGNGVVVIPSTLGGCPVTSIGYGAVSYTH